MNLQLLRKRAVWAGLLAVALGLGAQFILARGSLALGLIGYAAAATLFVTALRPLVPDTFSGDPTPADSPGTPAAGDGPEPAASPGKVRRSAAEAPAGGWAARLAVIRRSWRQLTVADILSGALPAPEPEGRSAPQGAAAAAGGTGSVPTDKAAPPGRARALKGSASKQAGLTAWAGDGWPFEDPQAVAVTSQGHVLVLDGGRNMVYRLDGAGRLLGRWSVPGLAQLRARSVAASPDGTTLYVADAANRGIQVIRLEEGDRLP